MIPSDRQCHKKHPLAVGGFSLIELLLALSMGIALSGTILQVLIGESDLGLRVNRLLRERLMQQRTLALIRDDVQRSSRISTTPQLEQHACTLGGRLPVLHLSTAAGPITYSVGAAPSGIWRGKVLMRCGSAYDLEGQPTVGTNAQNRVVIDGLDNDPAPWKGCQLAEAGGRERMSELAGSTQQPFSACLDEGGTMVAIRLVQQFSSSSDSHQNVSSEMMVTLLV